MAAVSFLSSLVLARWLFILIGLFSLAGLRFPRVYDSVIFNGLLAFLTVNLTFCLVTKISRTFRAAFKSFSKAGSLLLHAGVIVVMAGALLSKTKGYSYDADLSVGQEMPVRGGHFSLKIEDFTVELNESGQVSDYLTRAAVIQDGRTVLRKTIEVNAPLIFKGIHFYQSEYGRETGRIRDAEVELVSDSLKLDTVLTLPFPERTAFRNGSYGLRLEEFYCDFSIDVGTRKASNRSEEHRNPAVKYVVDDSTGNTLQEGWLFFGHPDFHGAGGSLFTLRPRGYVPAYFTGLQIRKNPGVPLIITGIIVMSLGLVLIFYLPFFKKRG